jgi:hypothetical protein
VSAESAHPGRPGPLAAALAQLEGWLLEPLPERAQPGTAAVPARPVLAVVGLAPGCGATTVACALAARLAARDPDGAAILAGVGPSFAPASRAAARLRLRLRDEGIPATAAGRLCFCQPPEPDGLAAAARRLAPLVLDAPAAMAPLADAAIVVAPAGAEPALAELFAQSLSAAGGSEPLIVVNRGRRDARWSGRASVFLPESHGGARLAAAGWEPRGALGRAITELGGLCEAAACA